MKRGILIMVINAIFTIAVISLSWYGAEILLYGYSQPSVVKAFAVLYMTLSSLAHQTRRGVVIYGTKEEDGEASGEPAGNSGNASAGSSGSEMD